MKRGPARPVSDGPPEIDANGLPVLDDELRAHAGRLSLVLTERPGSIKPCMFETHKEQWYERPGFMNGLNCDVCHPSSETLQREGYPGAKRNLRPAASMRKVVHREKWESPSSDLSGQTDPSTVLFGDEA